MGFLLQRHKLIIGDRGDNPACVSDFTMDINEVLPVITIQPLQIDIRDVVSVTSVLTVKLQ